MERKFVKRMIKQRKLVLITNTSKENVNNVRNDFAVYLKMVTLLMLFGNCGWRAEMRALQEQVNSIQEQINKQIIEQNCKNPRVLEFIKSCSDGQCHEEDSAQALRQMIEEKHVFIRLKPAQQLEEINEDRRIQLARMLDPDRLLPISKILIFIQSNDPRNWVRETNILGQRLRRYLVEKYQLSNGIIYRPMSLSCVSIKDLEIRSIYTNKISADKAMPGEPNDKEPMTAIWIFRVDCGSKQ